jgi:hypothetical protein
MVGLLCWSHLSEMLIACAHPSSPHCASLVLTTLRFACMVLIALRAYRLSEAMT